MALPSVTDATGQGWARVFNDLTAALSEIDGVQTVRNDDANSLAF